MWKKNAALSEKRHFYKQWLIAAVSLNGVRRYDSEHFVKQNTFH
jgi:hypothetical protein